MDVIAGLYMYDVVVKSSRSLSHLLMSSCFFISWWQRNATRRVTWKSMLLSGFTTVDNRQSIASL